MSSDARIVLGVLAGLLSLAFCGFVVAWLLIVPHDKPNSSMRFSLPTGYWRSDQPRGSLANIGYLGTEVSSSNRMRALRPFLLRFSGQAILQTRRRDFIIVVSQAQGSAMVRTFLASQIGNMLTTLCGRIGHSSTELVHRSDADVSLMRMDCPRSSKPASVAIAIFSDGTNAAFVYGDGVLQDFDMPAMRQVIETLR
jgi:hypothetical protein